MVLKMNKGVKNYLFCFIKWKCFLGGNVDVWVSGY